MSKRKPKPDPVLLDLETKLTLAHAAQDRLWSKLSRTMNALVKKRKQVLHLIGRIRRHKSTVSDVKPSAAESTPPGPAAATSPRDWSAYRPNEALIGKLDQIVPDATPNPNPRS